MQVTGVYLDEWRELPNTHDPRALVGRANFSFEAPTLTMGSSGAGVCERSRALAEHLPDHALLSHRRAYIEMDRVGQLEGHPLITPDVTLDESGQRPDECIRRHHL